MNILKSIKEKFLEFMYPNDLSCYLCSADLKRKTKTHICDKCKSGIPFIKRPCKKCGKDVPIDEVCENCLKRKYYFDKAVAVADYDGIARKSIYMFKKSNKRYVAKFMAYYMYCAYVNSKIDADVIMCVPMEKHKLKSRGFNQAQDLLYNINKYLHLEDVSSSLIAKESNISQKELTANERFKNAHDKFKVVNSKNIKDKKILLIDDIMTTGATASNVAKVLKHSGAKVVNVLTFASLSFKKQQVSEMDNKELIDFLF